MRRKKENNGIFILFVIVAVILAAILMSVLPASVSEWKQLIFFGTIIVVSGIEIAIYRMKKR